MTAFEPVDHRPAYRRIADAIEKKIASRELQAGEPLPSESELAKAFGVNRSTVREAVRELEGHGLIGRFRSEKALRVTSPGSPRAGLGLSRALALSGASFLELWEAMMALEPAAAELAAQRRSAADLTALRAAADLFRLSERAADAPASAPGASATASAAAVVQFFAAVGAASQNRVLSVLQCSINALLPPLLVRMLVELAQSRRRIVNAQKAIIDEIERADGAEARRWMERHVLDFRRGFELAGIPLKYVPDSPVATPLSAAASPARPLPRRRRSRAPGKMARKK